MASLESEVCCRWAGRQEGKHVHSIDSRGEEEKKKKKRKKKSRQSRLEKNEAAWRLRRHATRPRTEARST